MHTNLTRGTKNKFLRLFWAAGTAVLLAPSLGAQGNAAGAYQGPGVASPEAPAVGRRGGRDVDLRFFMGVSGVYDNTLKPLITDAKGNLVRLDGQQGVEVSAGAYGVHDFRHAQLGLDYHGAYRRYTNNSFYNGSDQALELKYVYQSSRRLVLTLYESAGSLIYGNTGVAAAATGGANSGLNRSAVFFDSRLNYLQSTAALTWLQSARTSYTISGSGFLQNRKQSTGLSNSHGYDFTGSITRRVSKPNSVGASYTYSHFEFPAYGMISDTNAYHGTFSSDFARTWTFSLQAGAAVTEMTAPFSFTLNPILAALFGQRTITGINYVRNIIPSGSAVLRQQFQRASLNFSYRRGVISGNGFTTTARQETATAGLSYTGLRKVSLNVDGGYYGLAGFAQTVGKTQQYSIGGGASYNLGRATHLNFRYDFRDQQVDATTYLRRGSRIAFGMLFSPGNIPLAVW